MTTPVRWPFPAELDAREAAVDVDEPWADDATGQPARHPLRAFIEVALEFAAGATIIGLLIALAFSFF
jgi:hypothetical protein